jgi:hypothetical protein
MLHFRKPRTVSYLSFISKSSQTDLTKSNCKGSQSCKPVLGSARLKVIHTVTHVLVSLSAASVSNLDLWPENYVRLFSVFDARPVLSDSQRFFTHLRFYLTLTFLSALLGRSSVVGLPCRLATHAEIQGLVPGTLLFGRVPCQIRHAREPSAKLSVLYLLKAIYL